MYSDVMSLVVALYAIKVFSLVRYSDLFKPFILLACERKFFRFSVFVRVA
jgi:hypothetical protein